MFVVALLPFKNYYIPVFLIIFPLSPFPLRFLFFVPVTPFFFFLNDISKDQNLNILVDYFSAKAFLGFSDMKSNHLIISNSYKLFGS